MTGKPIKIEFTSETDKYEKGVRDAAKATDKLADTIEDVPKATDRMADQARADFHRMGDDAGDAGREVGGEFKQNLGESLSSGDLSTIMQDTLGGLVSGLSGPLAGAAAAFAGVAVLGFQQVQKKAEEVSAATESILSLMRERFGMINAEMDTAFKRGQLKDFVTENIDLFQKLTPQLELMGVSADEYASAMLEGGESAQKMEERIRGILQAHTTLEGPLGREKPVYDDIAQAAQATLTALTDQKGAHKDAAAEAVAYDAIMNHTAQSIRNMRDDVKATTDLFAKKYTLDVRSTMSAQQLAAAFPYGTVGGASSSVYKPKTDGSAR